MKLCTPPPSRRMHESGLTTDTLAEAKLLDRVRSGDEQACALFVRKYASAMLATARRYLRCEQDCADAVQDALISALRSLDRFAGDSRVSTWLHRIVVNVCLMRLRARRRKDVVSIENLLPRFDRDGRHAEPIAPWDDDVAERLDSHELRVHVRACIDRLPDAYRTVLLLRDMEGLDTDQTAAALKLTPTNVKVRLHRARQALRTLLDPVCRGTCA